MMRAREQVGRPVSPVVSSTHIVQMDWKVLPRPMESDWVGRHIQGEGKQGRRG